MCNCGKKRTELKQQPHSANQIKVGVTHPPIQNRSAVLFQYTGNSGLSVVGNFTRKTYRFNFSGDVQSIDMNDARAMTSIPVLKRIG